VHVAGGLAGGPCWADNPNVAAASRPVQIRRRFIVFLSVRKNPGRDSGPDATIVAPHGHLWETKAGKRGNKLLGTPVFHPSDKPSLRSFFHLLRVQRRKDPVEGVVRRSAKRKRQKRLLPRRIGFAILGHLVSTLGSAQHRCNRDQQNLFQQVFPVSFHARIA